MTSSDHKHKGMKWPLVDAGSVFWPLFSRPFAPAVVAVPTLLMWPHFRHAALPDCYRTPRLAALAITGASVVTFAVPGKSYPLTAR